MVFAHTLGAGGPDLELFVLAGSLAILGVVFFLQKSVKPVVSFVVMAAAVGLGAGAFALGGSQSSNATVRIVSPAAGDKVPAGEVVTLDVVVDGAQVSTEADPSGGHLHVYVDGTLVSMPVNAEPTVELQPGGHTVTVEYVDADHASFSPPVQDEVRVDAR